MLLVIGSGVKMKLRLGVYCPNLIIGEDELAN